MTGYPFPMKSSTDTTFCFYKEMGFKRVNANKLTGLNPKINFTYKF